MATSAPAFEPDVDPLDRRPVEHGLGDLQGHDHDPPERPVERPVAGQDGDDPEGDPVASALHGQRGAQRQAVLLGELLGDHRAGLARLAQHRAGDQVEVVELGLGRRVDTQDRDRRWECLPGL